MMALPSRTLLRKGARGLTLLETLAALGIGVVAVVGALILFNTASSRSKTQDALTQMSTIVAESRVLFAGQADYANYDTEVAILAQVIPAKYAVDDDSAVTAWNTPLSVGDGDGTIDRSFFVLMEDVPQDACTQLIMQRTAGSGQGPLRVEVAGTALPSLDVNVGTATSACNADAQNIQWWFR